jgi:hypothetical protein
LGFSWIRAFFEDGGLGHKRRRWVNGLDRPNQP